ncbi:hypothetical protein BDK89_1567 [Ilumatobacter fluminis]|uniref:Uncharacterized protein n=1 Tax=Ilumatobacter fluminis TaxID=467091 RepID=A0A4R7HY25_9ACTN|nr:hypothetical protein [Ilumatobacter fluminis]TDT15985.1 hypothetical protein BDK89_1567 [Ilumatobacter fluminis]
MAEGPGERDGMREPVPRDQHVPDRMIAPPRWRYRVSAERRHRRAAITFGIIVVVGLAVMAGLWWLAAAVGLSGFVQMQIWLVPTIAALVWTIVGPSVAESTDRNDTQTWPGFAIRYGLVGEDEPRPLPARIVIAVVFGAPVAWALVVITILGIIGLME